MASNQNEVCIVDYSSRKAIVSLVFLIIIWSVPLINFVYSPSDFKHRHIDGPISTVGLLIALLWFTYVAVPALYRFKGSMKVTVGTHELKTSNGRTFDLRRLRELSIDRLFLRPRLVRVRFIDPADEIVISTAFQASETKLSAHEIVDRIRQHVLELR